MLSRTTSSSSRSSGRSARAIARARTSARCSPPAGRITDGDADSWLNEWTATAGAAWVAAVRARRSGRRVSALAHFRRAATYYATALYLISHSSEPDRRLDMWRRQRACWEQILDLSPVPGERVAIAYEDSTLPAFFFPATGRGQAPAARGGQQRLLPGHVRDVGAGGRRRGRARIPLADLRRPRAAGDAVRAQDSLPSRLGERFSRPVLDAMLARRDVDPDRVAVIGVGQGGYWVTRALAFEHRFAAAVVDPGIVDVSTAWTDRLPSAMREQLDDQPPVGVRSRDAPRRAVRAEHEPQTLRFHGEPYGHNGGSAFRLFSPSPPTTSATRCSRSTRRVLITESEGEPLWPGQSRQLYDRLHGSQEDRDLHRATRAPADIASRSLRRSARPGSSTGSRSISGEAATPNHPTKVRPSHH